VSIITVSRQYASGGAEIAATVARRLGWDLIDNAFVERVAELAGMPAEEVARLEERVPSFVERLARALAGSSPELFLTAGDVAVATASPEAQLVRVTEAVIAEAVRHDRVVLVGRGAQAYLGKREGTLHVYVVAPLDVRIRSAAERHGVGPVEAERMVHEIDENRRRYVKANYGRKWEDPDNYDLVLNSAAFGYDGCAAMIEKAVRLKGWGG
jgi:cytidylate kinase